MKTYAIRRRSNWADARELEVAAGRSARIGNEEMPHKVRWIRSYVVREDDGTLGTVCIYRAQDAAAIREHAARADLHAGEIHEVENTVIVRDDPPEESAAA